MLTKFGVRHYSLKIEKNNDVSVILWWILTENVEFRLTRQSRLPRIPAACRSIKGLEENDFDAEGLVLQPILERFELGQLSAGSLNPRGAFREGAQVR